MSSPNQPNQQKDISNMKKSLTLDFNHLKKSQLTLPLMNNPILDSPDISKLNLPTPELENIILNAGLSANTPTPSLMYSRPVTEEQESFATGFVNALNNLHNSNSQESSASSNYTEIDHVSTLPSHYTPIVLKEEPQNIPSSPPMSPVNMQYQERMKLERKRQRNRLAATKCRTRKLEKISKLEDKVKLLKSENADLGMRVHQLTGHVSSLKVELMQHINAGCQVLH